MAMMMTSDELYDYGREIGYTTFYLVHLEDIHGAFA